SEPATHPVLPSLTIISSRIPWAITAHASGKTLRYLTVADVLSAIHQALWLQIDEEHFRLDCVVMTQSGSHSPRRGGKGAQNAGITYRGGMTRLDLLAGKTIFGGLFRSEMGCDVWVLEV
ncbi:hypothetical protein B0H11DRAFT_1675145, partial [Mycena galericulata]